MKKISILSVFILALAFICGCAHISDPDSLSEPSAGTSDTASVSEDIAQEKQTEPETLFEGDFGAPKASRTGVKDGEYFTVDDIEEGFTEERDGMIFLDVSANELLEIGGLVRPSENNGEYYRLNALNRQEYSVLNEALASNPAGGTIRFRTNADRIAVDIKLYAVPLDFKHFAERGICGIDVYVGTGTDRSYCGGPMQFMTDTEELFDVIELPEGYNEVMIEMPQYAGVSWFYIGFPEGSEIAAPTERTNEPILFYGSSITQGASTGRPGNAYTNILCRALDCDCINLGFSSSDFGEQAIAEYITTRDFAVFVMDYNNNASVDQLRETHYDFYKTVRDAREDVPILFLTKPYYTQIRDEETALKEKIILETFNRAKNEGDKNVYFISSSEYFPEEQRNLYTIDMIHPNDLGHYYMAKTIFPVLYQIING